jgi:hypothetical protein
MSFLCEDGRYYKESTKEWVKPGNFRNGRLIASAKRSTEINAHLDDLESRLYAVIREIRKESKVTPEAIRMKITGQTEGFWQFFDSFLLNPPPSIGKDRVKHYRALYALLRKFGRVSDFNSFDQAFADRLTTFMRETEYKKLKDGTPEFYNDSTIKGTFKCIKALLGYAKKSEIIRKVPVLSTPARGIDAGDICLTPDKIRKMYECAKSDLHGINNPDGVKRSGKTFVLGTQIGTRVGYLKIRPENKYIDETGTYLDLITNKGWKPVLIPLSDLAIEIIDYFEWNIEITNEQQFNEDIKVVGELAGLHDIVIHRAIERGELVERTYHEFEMIASHTMRRSFATNMLLAIIQGRGFQAAAAAIPLIMKITGHTRIEQFLAYVKIDRLHAARILKEFTSGL